MSTKQKKVPSFEFRIGCIYNKQVVPEQSERYKNLNPKPVARRDLPKDFQESVQMGFNDYLLYNVMFDYDFATAIRPSSIHIFEDRPEDGEVCGWRDVAKKYAEKGLIINSIWGIRHGIPFARGSGEMVVPEDVHKFLLDTFGVRFLGYENGEQDGEYIAQYVFGSFGYPPQSPKRSRKEAYEDFVRFNRDYLDKLFHYYIATIGSMCFSHYYAEIGHRMVGLELGTGLASSIMRWTFLRGASKQYELLTHGHISVFMASAEQKPDFYSGKHYPKEGLSTQVEFLLAHPGGGPSIGLMKRLWFASYMYGASLLGLEGGLFYDDVAGLPEDYWGKEAKGIKPIHKGREAVSVCDVTAYSLNRGAKVEANLSPLGREFRKWVWATRAHSERGVQYVPFALVMDFYHGWSPPVHRAMGQGKPEHVWGNIPDTLGDYHIDEFFRWIFPGYLEYGFSIEERGCLTPTPFGDSFDVILTNATEEVLNKYQAAILVGDVPSNVEFEERVKKFVSSGHTLILCTRQLSEEFLLQVGGIKIAEKNRQGRTSCSLVDEYKFDETSYSYDVVTSEGASVLAVNKDGHPLVCVNTIGNGKVITITPLFWGRGVPPDYKWHIIEGLPWDQNYRQDFFRGRQSPPVQFLRIIRHIIEPILHSYELIEVSGRPIQYIVNVTKDPRKLLITLINNGEVDWEGTVKVKSQNIVMFEEWLSCGEVSLKDGTLLVAVAASDVRIYAVTCEKPFLDLLDNE